MTDYAALKLAADAVSSADEWYSSKTISAFPEYENDADFVIAASPAAVLALIAENERLTGLQPSFPPRPPDGEGLPRFGLRWNGPQQPLAVAMEDGYWTPWHLADQLRAEVAGLNTGYEAYERVNAELKAEIVSLKDEISADDKIIADRDRLLNLFECQAHGQCVPYAMEQVAALRKDADRYRWLKVDGVDRDDLYTSTSGVDMDSAIDAALDQGERP